jgi:pyridoxamine 5'-phosphate oxidase
MLDGAFSSDPIAWFQHVFEQAQRQESNDASRAALATVDADGQPNVRYVLVKGADERGFVFFTNYRSAKAEALRVRPRAALAFHWWSTGVQVRVEGSASEVSAEESDAYFATRPRGSQLAAWASEQSQPIESRAALEHQLETINQRFPDNTYVARPPHWGGFLIRPQRIELWQNHAFRLHDRWNFRRDEAGAWRGERLQP